MSNFYVRARVIGDGLEYYKAVCLDDYFSHHAFGVRFEEGPHAGEVFPEERCRIALQNMEQVEKRRNENSKINI